MRTTVEMAREAGLHCAVLLYMYGKESALCDSEIEELRRLERFAELVRADEREAACDIVDYELDSNGHAEPIKIAIRARGETK